MKINRTTKQYRTLKYTEQQSNIGNGNIQNNKVI